MTPSPKNRNKRHQDGNVYKRVRRKAQKHIEEKTEQRIIKGGKPIVVATKKDGFVTSAFEGKEEWDDMIRTLSNQYLDYSIVDINRQCHVDIEKIRDELNKEFVWDEPPLSFSGLKNSLGSFMK
jgi:hypothetical protein